MSTTGEKTEIAPYFAGLEAVLPATLGDVDALLHDNTERMLRKYASGQKITAYIRDALSQKERIFDINLGKHYIDPKHPLYQSIKKSLLSLDYVSDAYLRQAGGREGSENYGNSPGVGYCLTIKLEQLQAEQKAQPFWKRLLGLGGQQAEQKALPAPGTADNNLKEKLLADFEAGGILVRTHAAALNIDPAALSQTVERVKEVIADQKILNRQQWQKSGRLVLELGKAFANAHEKLPEDCLSPEMQSELSRTYQAAITHLEGRIADVESRDAQAAASEIGVGLAVLQLQFENP